MPPRINHPVDDLIKALQDESVQKAITALFDNRLDQILSRMDDLLKENTHLRQCLDKANTKIDEFVLTRPTQKSMNWRLITINQTSLSLVWP